MAEIKSLSKSDKMHLAGLAHEYVYPGKTLTVTGDGRVTTNGDGFLGLKNKQSSDFLSVILLSIGKIIDTKGEIEQVKSLCMEGIHIMNSSNDRSEVINRIYQAHLATGSNEIEYTPLPRAVDVSIELRSEPEDPHVITLGKRGNLSANELARYLNQNKFIVFRD